MGWAIIAVAVLSTAAMTWATFEQQQCNEAITRNLEARVQWNNEDRIALHGLIVAVFTDDNDAAQERAFHHWLDVTRDNERARDAHPLPQLAECD